MAEQPDFSRKNIDAIIARQHAEVQRLNDQVAADRARAQARLAEAEAARKSGQ
jgi:hypothetical protein